MVRSGLILVLLGACPLGCSTGPGDLSQEKSPSATGDRVRSAGPAKLKASFDKLQGVGKGDGVIQMGSSK
ncbi:MAG: hypothetical protein P4L46_24190 [Fimbriimonas sp.]|nr:hypothetical protein [Fimbriimonas sp.]